MIRFDWNNIEETALDMIGAEEPEWFFRSSADKAWHFAVAPHMGEGWLEYYQCADELNILVMNCEFAAPRDIIVEDGMNLRFNFALTLDVQMQTGSTGLSHALTQSWRVINTHSNLEMKEHVAPEHRNSWVTIHCSPDLLIKLAGKEASDMPEMLQPLPEWYNGKNINSPFESDPRLVEAVSRILDCKLEDNLRVQYVQARAIELLCLALHLLLEPPRSAPQIKLSTEEEAAIRVIAERLRTDFKDPPSIATLAKDSGINRNKLFYGFRNLYGVTVSRYLQNLRLERGYELLKTTDFSLIEICEHSGFSHQSNFSTAVRKRFGMSPKELRKSDKKSDV